MTLVQFGLLMVLLVAVWILFVMALMSDGASE